MTPGALLMAGVGHRIGCAHRDLSSSWSPQDGKGLAASAGWPALDSMGQPHC